MTTRTFGGHARRIRARVLEPMGEKELRWHPDLFLAWDEAGRLTQARPYAGEAVDADRRSRVLMPSFVDAHVHFPQTRAMGHADAPLLPWLEQSIFPQEARFADESHAEQVAAEFCAHLLRAGTTAAFVYGSSHEVATDRLFAALEHHRIAAHAGPVLMDQDAPEELCVGVGDAMAALGRLHRRWQRRSEGRLALAVIPRFALSCSAAMMDAAADFARDHGLWVSTHIAETVAECEAVCERFEAHDYLEVYERHRLMGAKTLLAHCIHLDEAQWGRLAAAGGSVAHCPDSNDFLGSGSMPTRRAHASGAGLTIGSDVAAGRGFCMRAHMRAAYDCALRDGYRSSPAQLLWWATQGARRILGWAPPDAGALEPGAWADFVEFDLPAWIEADPEALARAIVFDPTHVRIGWVWAGGRAFDPASGSGP